jgi:hypothetical protein
MPDLSPIPLSPRTLDELEAEGLADARLRLRRGIRIVGIAIPILVALAWLMGDIRFLGYGAPILLIIWTLLRASADPSRLVRSETQREVSQWLSQGSPPAGLLRPDLPSAERHAHLHALLDVLEGPDTFFNRHAKTLGPIGFRLGAVGWLAGGIASVVLAGDWGSAIICLIASLAFFFGGRFAMRADAPRYEAIALVKSRLGQLELAESSGPDSTRNRNDV